MKKLTIFIVLILINIFLHTNRCFSENFTNFYLESNITNPVPGEDFSIKLNLRSNKETNISVFRIKLEFDYTLLKYKGIYSKYGSNDFKVSTNQNNLTVIFLTSEKGINLQKNSEETLLEINFKVFSDAREGVSKFSANIDSIASYNEERIPLVKSSINTYISIEKTPESDCDLKYLAAEDYNLTPKFSKNIKSYSVTVPSNKNSIEITAIANDPRAKVTVNRKTLNSAGKNTDIKVTVSSADKKSRKIYTIYVKRLETLESFDVLNNRTKNNNSISDKNKSTQNEAENISIVRNHFNLFLFLSVSLFCIILGFLVLKSKK